MTKCDSGITESARYTGRPAGYRGGSAVLRPPTQLLLLQTVQTLTIFAVTNRASIYTSQYGPYVKHCAALFSSRTRLDDVRINYLLKQLFIYCINV